MAWHCKAKGAYARDSDEAIENAKMIYGVLSAQGWTLNAVCGVLGNIGAESGYNPWRWQSDKIGVSTGFPWNGKGYGLVQFTTSGATEIKYIDNPLAKQFDGYGPNFSDKDGNVNDGNAQMLYVDGYADYYSTSSYPMSYADFKVSDLDSGYLAKVWLSNYERPPDIPSKEPVRASEAEYWYQVLSGEPPIPPTPSGSLSFIEKFMIIRRFFRG